MKIEGWVIQRFWRTDDCKRTQHIVPYSFNRIKDIVNARVDRLNRRSRFAGYRVLSATLTIEDGDK